MEAASGNSIISPAGSTRGSSGPRPQLAKSGNCFASWRPTVATGVVEASKDCPSVTFDFYLQPSDLPGTRRPGRQSACL